MQAVEQASETVFWMVLLIQHVRLDQLRDYSAKCTLFTLVGVGLAIAFAPFSPGGPLSLTHYQLTGALAGLAVGSFLTYLACKLIGYRRERARRADTESTSITDITDDWP